MIRRLSISLAEKGRQRSRHISAAEMAFPELVLHRPDRLVERQSKRRTMFCPTAVRATMTWMGQNDEEEDLTELLTDAQRLATSPSTASYAAYAMLVCVMAEGIQEMSVMPNYPLMVTPGAHPDSFTNTGPFGITTAQYLLCSATAIAMMISNLVSGKLADQYGQKKMVLFLTSGSIICNIAKFLARRNFWAFLVLCFFNGLFGGTVAVANSYMSLLFHDDQKQVDSMIGYVTTTSIASFSVGGLLTILFESSLFMPLIPAACFCFISAIVAYTFVLHPKQGMVIEADSEHERDINKDHVVTKLDRKLLANIIVGALFDNVGSLGVTPLAFSPVLYQRFFLQFKEIGDEPIMTENDYRLAYTMISVTIIPTGMLCTWLFQKIGPAKSCVLANVLTGGTIIALAFIASGVPSKTTYALFLSTLFIGAPFTFVSNVSTGPMLDRITPINKKGAIHGINNAIFKFSAACFQLILGILADSKGDILVLWICVGISFLAALVNLPLIFNPRLGTIKEIDDGTAALLNGNQYQSLLDDAKYLPLKEIFSENEMRAETGEPFLQTRFGKYSRENVDQFSRMSTEDLIFLRNKVEQRINVIHNDSEMKALYLQSLNASRPDQDDMEEKMQDLEKWVSAYLLDSGYFVGIVNPQLFKALFVKSFPMLNHGPEVSEDELESILINTDRLLNVFLERETQVEKRWGKLMKFGSKKPRCNKARKVGVLPRDEETGNRNTRG